ncbi:MAG: SDR family NAD(P)-dependent oxidoreductase [Spirochaetales bacterium]|nr:SDR family NAD(P)-dependent oxidoreductase [Spirochaetales bacterium]
MDTSRDLVIITGTDSGIGMHLAGVFREHGYPVCATYLEKPGTTASVNINLDLTDEASCSGFIQKVASLLGEGYRCACLVNNAGIALGGPIENLPISVYRANLEVNLLGLIRITRDLIPFLAESRGVILLNGSAAGRVAAPFLSPYVITKFALEGFADCLRRELLPYGIRTVLLQTGGVDTPIWKKAETQDMSFVADKYRHTMDRFRDTFIRGSKGLSAGEAAEKIFRVFRRKKYRPRYIIARSVAREIAIRLISGRPLDFIFKRMFGMDYGGR